MNEFEELYGDEFFVIDSENLLNVESRLYGYLIDGGNFYTNNNFNINANLTGLGAYIHVNKTYNEITISQDANGCFGLYVYQYDDIFCISNSFVKLIDYVKTRYPISFNEDAAGALLACKFSSYIYKQTLVNEIIVLPRNYVIKIDENNKKIKYELIDYAEKTIPLDSQKAFDILDDWFYRWTSLFRNLKKQTNNITADLTGGFDSRLTFSLLLASNINLDEINIRSVKDNEYTHKEDYQIASQMAKEFNFKLNDMSKFDLNRYYFEEKETSIKISAYTKLGVHNQLFYKFFKNLNPCYSITGYGGENIRDYHGVTPLEKYISNANALSPELVEYTKNALDYNVNQIKKDFFGNYEDDNIEYAISKEAVHTYHFGRGSIEKYLTNEFGLNPLTDPEINKIKRHDGIHIDKNLLISIIYLRYCPEILNFDFEGDSEIRKDTIEYAKKINAKYPFNFNGYEPVSSNIQKTTGKQIIKDKLLKYSDLENTFKNAFLSNAFKKQFEIYYSPELYNNLAIRVKTWGYVPLQYAYPAIIVMKVLNDIKINNFDANKELIPWLDEFSQTGNSYDSQDNISIMNKLLIYNTSRIDIINHGTKNNVELINVSDKKCRHRSPSWVKPEQGGGVIIESEKNSMNLTLKCINDGELSFSLKAMDIRDKNRKRFPVYIDYTYFKVNDEVIIDENKLTWHDQPFVYKKKVVNNEEITIEVKWKPFDSQSTFKFN